MCRFRIRLMVNNKMDGLLADINDQIQLHGLMIKGTSGAVIDATLIESATRLNKSWRWMLKARPFSLRMAASRVFPVPKRRVRAWDAAWLKKGKKSYFGYQSYMMADTQGGYMRGVHTAPVN